nr:NADH dehydrogenase subunit 2 [Acanalonia sp.]
MKLNLTKMLFLTNLVTSTVATLASNTIFTAWVMMEINFMSFLPLMSKSKKMTDQPMKYFIIQSLSSSLMLMSIMVNSIMEAPLTESMLMLTSMMMKIGLIPFHLWMPSIMQNMSWENCMIFTTIQKIPPMIIIAQTLSLKMLMVPMCATLLLAPMSAINQLSTKKIMAYSSISNSPWMIFATMSSKMQMVMMFTIYTMITINMMKKFKSMNLMFMNQMMMKTKNNSMEMIVNMLSLSGIPPMIGFFPKWMILSSSIQQSISMASFMILSSVLSSFIYLKMMSPMLMSFTMLNKLMIQKPEISSSLMLNILGIPLMAVILKSI